MKKLIILSGLTLMFAACGTKETEVTAANPETVATTAPPVEQPVEAVVSADLNSTPEAVINTLATAAKSGDHSQLANLCSASVESDGDCKSICALASDPKKAKEFNEYFSTLIIDGTPEINGDKAKVNIKFGPDASKKETMNMVKADGKWYLSSF